MILFTAREMSGGIGHQHVSHLWWRNSATGKTGDMDIATAIEWLDKKTSRAFVEDQEDPGSFVEAFVAKPDGQRWYIRTYANRRWTDNLLALPLKSRQIQKRRA